MYSDIDTVYLSVRKTTENLCHCLHTEDYVVQSMADVSPPKWHLAHTTWFFENFILKKHFKKYVDFDPAFNYYFNSYYYGTGQPFPREKRGLLSRPTVKSIYLYRKHVDQHILELMQSASDEKLNELRMLITLGLHHEQQHQELLLMDLKHNFFCDPSYPVYQANNKKISLTNSIPLDFLKHSGGLVTIGANSNEFSFDHELPMHQEFLRPFSIGNKLVTNAEFLEFIEAGGYENYQWWLANGWDFVNKEQWKAPLYWLKEESNWYQFSLSGIKKLESEEPVSHISYFEADAFARFRGKRLPSEAEWENIVSAKNTSTENANFLENKTYHPTPLADTQTHQFYGDLWEWTSSSYLPYPGYKPVAGILGEYNAKFMNNQQVLKGGSCITPQSHIRLSYRNYFQPEKRWQFSGIRLAGDD